MEKVNHDITPASILADEISMYVANTMAGGVPLSFTAVLFLDGGYTLTAYPVYQNEKEKIAQIDGLRFLVDKHKCTMHVFFHEGWLSHDTTGVAPSQASDKQECVMIYATAGSDRCMKIYLVERLDDGKVKLKRYEEKYDEIQINLRIDLPFENKARARRAAEKMKKTLNEP